MEFDDGGKISSKVLGSDSNRIFRLLCTDKLPKWPIEDPSYHGLHKYLDHYLVFLIYVISEQLEPLNENNKQINNTYKSKILDMAINELNNNSFLHKNEKKVLYNFNDILKIFNDDLDSKALSSPIINTDDEYEGFQSISDENSIRIVALNKSSKNRKKIIIRRNRSETLDQYALRYQNLLNLYIDTGNSDSSQCNQFLKDLESDINLLKESKHIKNIAFLLKKLLDKKDLVNNSVLTNFVSSYHSYHIEDESILKSETNSQINGTNHSQKRPTNLEYLSDILQINNNRMTNSEELESNPVNVESYFQDSKKIKLFIHNGNDGNNSNTSLISQNSIEFKAKMNLDERVDILFGRMTSLKSVLEGSYLASVVMYGSRSSSSR